MNCKRSALPLTGRCHFCGKETKNRFCDTSCNDKYNVYKRRGKIGYIRPEQRYTARRLTPEQLEKNIERVVQNAIDNGTYYGTAQLAPQQ